jgi:N-carbamoylputrescine amidase
MTTTVALLQFACGADPDENQRHAEERTRESVARGAQIVCLPELYRTQYFPQREDVTFFDLAEAVPGPSTERWQAVARELGIVIVAPLFERRAPGVYHNTVAVIDADGTYLGKYRKMHIPDDPLFYEKFYFTPGDLRFRVWKTKHGTIGALICWDQWFPEGARLAALAGATMLFYPTAIGWLPAEKAIVGGSHLEAWETIQRGHAIANGVYVFGVNRVGHERLAGDGIEFWGRSFASDPHGRMLAKAGEGEETLMVGCSDELVEHTRRSWPFLRDRRIDAYGQIVERMIDG